MAWFRFEIEDGSERLGGIGNAGNTSFQAQVSAIPGVTVRAVGSYASGTHVALVTVTCHENAAWLVEQLCRKTGVRYTVSETKRDAQPLESLDALVAGGLREWVPEYLTEYQRDGIMAMAHRDGAFWWAAGSGKTLGAICWALAAPGRTVLVTRAGVRRQHAREIERVSEHRALVLEESADAEQLETTDALFCLVGYEMLPAVVDRLLLWKPKNMILDESHTNKSPKRWSATAQADGKLKFDLLENIAVAAYRLSRAVQRRLATTATPIKDRTRDLWAQLDLVHPDAWGRFYAKDKASFTGRYCAAREGMYGGIDTTGASNLDELWNRVSLVTHHVPHSVTHRHLPPRRRVVTYVTPAEQVRADGFTQKFFKAAAKGGQTGLLEARLMEAAAKKRKALKGMVDEAVACGQKVTIFTGRREDCDRLGEEMQKDHPDVTIWSAHGGTSAKDRDGIQQEYMRHPGPCVLVGTGDAWGTGVSLHDTDLALIAMLPYTPGAIVQWEGRFSRQGQKRPVLIQYLVAEGTVDEHVVELLLGKLKPVEKVVHDDSIEGFADSLRGADEEEAIVQSILGKLGI